MEKEEANKIKEERDQRRETYKETLAEIKSEVMREFDHHYPDELFWFENVGGDIGEEVQCHIMDAPKGERFFTSENCIELSVLANFLRKFRDFESLLTDYNRDMLYDTEVTYQELLWLVMKSVEHNRREIESKYESEAWEKRQEVVEE